MNRSTRQSVDANKDHGLTKFHQWTIHQHQSTEFVNEAVQLLKEELHEARELLREWHIGENNQSIQSMLWCLKGSCSSFGISSLVSKVENAHKALNSEWFSLKNVSISHIFQELIWCIDATIDEIGHHN